MMERSHRHGCETTDRNQTNTLKCPVAPEKESWRCDVVSEWMNACYYRPVNTWGDTAHMWNVVLGVLALGGSVPSLCRDQLTPKKPRPAVDEYVSKRITAGCRWEEKSCNTFASILHHFTILSALVGRLGSSVHSTIKELLFRPGRPSPPSFLISMCCIGLSCFDPPTQQIWAQTSWEFLNEDSGQLLWHAAV